MTMQEEPIEILPPPPTTITATTLSNNAIARHQRVSFTEEFIALWKEHRNLWDAHCPLYRDKHERIRGYQSIGDQLSLSGMILYFIETYFQEDRGIFFLSLKCFLKNDF